MPCIDSTGYHSAYHKLLEDKHLTGVPDTLQFQMLKIKRVKKSRNLRNQTCAISLVNPAYVVNQFSLSMPWANCIPKL